MDEHDTTTMWRPSLHHPTIQHIFSADDENKWYPERGWKWLNPGTSDLRVVRAGPTEDQVAAGVLKALGALAAHVASKPRPDDGIAEEIARALARELRDSFLDEAVKDLFPDHTPTERRAIRNLAIQAIDGRLAPDRDIILAELRRTNRDMADAVEVLEFLLRLAQAVHDNR